MVRKLIGRLMIDSGQIFITDPGYLNSWQPGEYDGDTPPDNSYARVTTFMFEHGYGEVEHGIVIGIDGDGLPPVYVVEDEHGTILKIEIDFQNINLPSDPI